MSPVTESWLTPEIRALITRYTALNAYKELLYFRTSRMGLSHGEKSKVARALMYRIHKCGYVIINGYMVTEYTQSRTYPKVFKLERLW